MKSVCPAISLSEVWGITVKVMPSFSGVCLDLSSIRPLQLGAVGLVVYALNELSPLSSFVIR